MHSDFFDDANEKVLEIVKETNKTLIHAFNDRDVIIGQSLLVIEILDQAKDAEYVLVPVGGGGLLAGLIVILKQLIQNVN